MADTVIAQVVRNNKTSRNMLSLTEFKGMRLLQIKEMWRDSEDSNEWKYGKRIVTFNLAEYAQFVANLKSQGIERFDQLLSSFGEGGD